MLKSLTLGNKTFSVNLIQGPLAGVSCAPFRKLIWKYSKPAFTYTEMISCKTVLYQPTLTYQRFIAKDIAEGPLGVQLSSNHPDELAEAVKIITDFEVDLIDLNCGCPVKKIRQRGTGSKLLSDAMKLYHLIDAMKKNTPLPVSIKIRVDGNSQDKFNQEIAKAVQDAGADFLIVHGRHWMEQYETPCRYDEIRFFVDALTIPVIGNGDIACLSSLQKMFETGCAGFMISRASMGRPWLINQLMTEMRQESYFLPDIKERAAIFIDHVVDLSALLASEKFAILHARKFAKYYARDLKTREQFCEAVNHCETLSEFKRLCLRYFTESFYSDE